MFTASLVRNTRPMDRPGLRVLPPMHRVTHLFTPLLLLILLAAPLASADVVDGPPACPPGALGRSSHAGTWCEAAPCATDADCSEGGGSCRAWRVCTRRASIPLGGHAGLREPAPPPYQAELVVGRCDPARACRGDEEASPPAVGEYVDAAPTCLDAMFCVPAGLPAFPLVQAPPAPAPVAPLSPPPTAGPVAPPPQSSCDCHAHGGSRSGGLWPALGLLVVALRRRR